MEPLSSAAVEEEPSKQSVPQAQCGSMWPNVAQCGCVVQCSTAMWDTDLVRSVVRNEGQEGGEVGELEPHE